MRSLKSCLGFVPQWKGYSFHGLSQHHNFFLLHWAPKRVTLDTVKFSNAGAVRLPFDSFPVIFALWQNIFELMKIEHPLLPGSEKYCFMKWSRPWDSSYGPKIWGGVWAFGFLLAPINGNKNPSVGRARITAGSSGQKMCQVFTNFWAERIVSNTWNANYVIRCLWVFLATGKQETSLENISEMETQIVKYFSLENFRFSNMRTRQKQNCKPIRGNLI